MFTSDFIPLYHVPEGVSCTADHEPSNVSDKPPAYLGPWNCTIWPVSLHSQAESSACSIHLLAQE